jgi:citrate synthase
MQATTEVADGLEGVVAFATEIAEPDRAGGALRYRGVDIEALVGRVPFERVWGLLVDGRPSPGLPAEEPLLVGGCSGDTRADLQAELARLAPHLHLRQLIDLEPEQARDDLARTSALALSIVAQSPAAATGRRFRTTSSRRPTGQRHGSSPAGEARPTRRT